MKPLKELVECYAWDNDETPERLLFVVPHNGHYDGLLLTLVNGFFDLLLTSIVRMSDPTLGGFIRISLERAKEFDNTFPLFLEVLQELLDGDANPDSTG